MIDREIAVLLRYPTEILGATRLGGAREPVAYCPGQAAPDRTDGFGTVPVFQETRPVRGPADDWACMVVVTRPGPPGERLFGHRGIGRRIHLVDVLSYGKEPDVNAGGDEFEDSRQRADEANHVVACGMSAKVLTDWPPDGWTGDTTGLTLGSWGEVEVQPVALKMTDTRDRPVYGFTARIVRWA